MVLVVDRADPSWYSDEDVVGIRTDEEQKLIETAEGDNSILTIGRSRKFTRPVKQK